MKTAPPDDPAFWVVEEGLNGRTSCREDPVEGDRNGIRQLLPFLGSHKPIDLVIVMLGTNDLKPRYSPTAYDIARGVQRLAIAAQDSRTGPGDSAPKVLIICPPPTEDVPAMKHIFGNSMELSKKMAPYYRKLAQECGALFLDAGKVIRSSMADGIHLDAESHLRLAEAVAEIILNTEL
ncbi:GDSL-type esterase/lipase family protein [Treponema sp. OttesenSCG-928-L16]|nr:GDSL-type esterase/lipase family protein [Treponema sp. OttesenSCG-928-L16]